MLKVSQMLLILLFIVLMVVLHIGFSYILPYPWSKINVLFVILMLLMLWRESGLVVWLAFSAHFFLELYATTPFGVVLFSSTISILLSYWLYKIIFTNRSWFAAVFLGLCAVLIYRSFYLIILLILKLFHLTPFIFWRYGFLNIFWELTLTTAVLGLIYFTLSRFSKKLNVTVIQHSTFGL